MNHRDKQLEVLVSRTGSNRYTGRHVNHTTDWHVLLPATQRLFPTARRLVRLQGTRAAKKFEDVGEYQNHLIAIKSSLASDQTGIRSNRHQIKPIPILAT